MAFKVEKMEVKKKLEEATKVLHYDMYNREAQGLVNFLRFNIEMIDKWKAKGVAVRSRAKWEKKVINALSKFFG